MVLADSSGHADFAFVFVTNSLEHDYYKWKIASQIFGDDRDHYRMDPFMLTTDGAVYYPPEHFDLPE